MEGSNTVTYEQLLISTRIDALFTLWEGTARVATETVGVAAKLRSQGHDVSAEELTAARAGTDDYLLTGEVLEALATHFHTKPEYLTSSDPAVYGPIHAEIMLMRRFKDGGVTQIHLRGEPVTSTRRLIDRILGNQQR